MKIAQVAPLRESVPPQRYGGTERIVSYLTEELVRLGHEVTLFAAGDSVTSAALHAGSSSSLRSTPKILFPDALVSLHLERAFGTYAAKFDVIHSHLDVIGFPLARRCPTPVVTTLHSRLDLPELMPVFERFPELPVVSLLDAQRASMPGANWQRTIHPGLPQNLYSMHPHLGTYLAFLGRIAPGRGVEQAIELAMRTGMPLRIAAKVDAADRAYFEHIAPILEHPLVEYVGEITDDEKDDFLGEAYALVYPVEKPEPFSVVLIEALACGTPVLAYRSGGLPEIVDHGVTGYLCDNVAEMAHTVAWIPNLDRHRCREAFEKRFTAERMVQDYLLLYQRILHKEEDRSADHDSLVNHAAAVASLRPPYDARIEIRHAGKHRKAKQLAV
jgi:glycosyltransferase involved in cell wall biosynthesis